MKCKQCSEQFQWLGDNPPEEPICPSCIDANHKHDVARARSNRVHYYKELVVIGKGEFECSGYYEDGRLWDEEITVNGVDVYGLLSDHTEAQIYEEICRRVVSDGIDKVCEKY